MMRTTVVSMLLFLAACSAAGSAPTVDADSPSTSEPPSPAVATVGSVSVSPVPSPTIDAGSTTAEQSDAACPPSASPVTCPAPPVCPVCPSPPDAGVPSVEPAQPFPLLVASGKTWNVVVDGDSRAAGSNLPVGGASWPQLVGLLAGPDVTMHNVAQPGATTTTLLQRGAANVDPLFVTGAHNVLIVLIGVNDIRALTSTAQLAAPEGNFQAYAAQRRGHGWQVYVIPDLPAGLDTKAVWEAWVDFERSSAFVDVVIDAPPPFDDFTAGVNPHWSQDGIHPTQAGYVRIADAVSRKLAGTP